ncbi:MAG: hypothetical protein H6668_22145 [Ardenticatenaceae bacterium]|nr:hypothetical protein [Ardenticatenaceae bacterium]
MSLLAPTFLCWPAGRANHFTLHAAAAAERLVNSTMLSAETRYRPTPATKNCGTICLLLLQLLIWRHWFFAPSTAVFPTPLAHSKATPSFL